MGKASLVEGAPHKLRASLYSSGGSADAAAASAEAARIRRDVRIWMYARTAEQGWQWRSYVVQIVADAPAATPNAKGEGPGGHPSEARADLHLDLELELDRPVEDILEGTWLFLERPSTGEAEPDIQLLLCNLRAHETCLRLLRMDFKHEEVLDAQVPLRVCMQAAYRLLRAMCVGLAPVQMEVNPHLHIFVTHAAAQLGAHDVSPTGLISAIHRGNRTVCEQATEELVTYFVSLAANERAPRYLRFLRMLATPEGRPTVVNPIAAVQRNQTLIMQALRANENALVLCNEPDGIRQRAAMIAQDEQRTGSQTRDPLLQYHFFMVGLLGDCAVGLNATAEMLVRELVSLTDLMKQLVLPELPLPLRSDYLILFTEAYLLTRVKVKWLLDASELPALLAFLVDVIHEASAQLEAIKKGTLEEEGDDEDGEGGGGGGAAVAKDGVGGGGSAVAKTVFRGANLEQLEVFTYEGVVGALIAFFERYYPSPEERQRAEQKKQKKKSAGNRGSEANLLGRSNGDDAVPPLVQLRSKELAEAILLLDASDPRVKRCLRAIANVQPKWVDPATVKDLPDGGGKQLVVADVKLKEHPADEWLWYIDRFEEVHKNKGTGKWAEWSGLVDVFMVDVIEQPAAHHATGLLGQPAAAATKTTTLATGAIVQSATKISKIGDLQSPLSFPKVTPLYPSDEAAAATGAASKASTAASKANADERFPFAIGARVVHVKHGPGEVVEHMSDGKTRVDFDSGEAHRYKASSMHKFFPEEAAPEDDEEAAVVHVKPKGPTHNLIEQLLSGIDAAQTVASVRVLIELLQSTDAAQRTRRQRTLDAMGASRVALMLASSEAAEMCEVGLQLGQALLDGGNRDVQASMYEHLSGAGGAGGDGPVKAYDGSRNTFFDMMRTRLRLAAKEVPERKLYLEYQAVRLRSFEKELVGFSSAAKAALEKETKKEFASRALATDVLRLLQLMCEGHYNAMQTTLRHQPYIENVDIDLLSDTYELLQTLEPQVDSANQDQVQLCVDLLIEAMQGNEGRANQKFLVEQTKLLQVLQRLLVMDGTERNIEVEPMLTLKKSCCECLLSLLERSQKDVEFMFLEQLDTAHLAQQVGEFHAIASAAASKDEAIPPWPFGPRARPDGTRLHRDPTKRRVQEERIAATDAGFLLYVVLRQLADYQRSHPDAAGEALGSTAPILAAVPAAAADEYGAMVATVELLMPDGELERVYFRIPEVCPMLTKMSRVELHNMIDRKTPGKRTIEFVESFDGLYLDMKNQQWLGSFRLWQAIKKPRQLFGYEIGAIYKITDVSTFVVACFVNGLILLESKKEEGDGSNEGEGAEHDAAHTDYPISFEVLGIMMCISTTVTLMYRVVDTSAERVQRAAHEQAKASGQAEGLSYLWMPLWLLQDTVLVWNTTLCAFAFLGVTYEVAFFCLHLFDITFKFEDLKKVFIAIKVNVKPLVLTFMLMVIFMYAFGVIGFTLPTVRDDFVGSHCDTVFECFMSMFDDALRNGDAGGVMGAASWRAADTPSDSSARVATTLFMQLYYFLVLIFMLNAIFGIILDSFAELRGADAAKKADMDNVCFICGLDRFDLDTKGGGFETHIENDHNMWHYLYLYVHLKQKPPTEYNGWESYVDAELLNHVLNKPPAFIPRLTAIALKDHEEAEAAESRQIGERQMAMQSELASLSKTVREMAGVLKGLKDQLLPAGAAAGAARGGVGGTVSRLSTRAESTSPAPRALARR